MVSKSAGPSMAREADHVFVLMTSEHRVSRNTRANWYFNHLNADIRFNPNRALEDFTEEIEIVSVVPRSDDDRGKAKKVVSSEQIYHISPNTKVTFLARRYRFVFVLDLSPSVATVDIQTNSVLYEEIFVTLSRSLRGLCAPAYIPGSRFLLVPEIFITVLAHTPFYTSEGQQVIVQGWKISSENIESLLRTIYKRLKEVTVSVAEVTACASEPKEMLQNRNSCGAHWLNGEVDKVIHSRSQNQLASADLSILSMFRYALLALPLLPEPSSTGVVIITDGMLCLPKLQVLENVLTQLRSDTIACSFLQIGSGPHPWSCLGYVPYTKMMKFLATATFGVYLPVCPKIEGDSLENKEFNLYHQAFLSWNFQRGLSESNVDDLPVNVKGGDSNIRNPYFYSTHDSEGGLLQHGFVANDQQLVRHKQLEGKVFTKFTNLLSCRLREGYTIKQVNLYKADGITVNLLLPFQYNCNFEYILSANWTPASSQALTADQAEMTECHFELYVEAHYTYLHDVTCQIRKPFKSAYRRDAAKRFWFTLSCLTESDKDLVHLNSFTQHAATSVPEGILSGVPLFYLPPNPPAVPTLTSKSSVHHQFASYWLKVCLLDVRIWHRWMHVRRIDLVLEHDFPLPKHLHLPDNNGRYTIVSCRQAAKEVYVLLKEYSSFVMLENRSYIKFIYGYVVRKLVSSFQLQSHRSNSEVPESFFVIRVITQVPYMEIHLAFVGGTSGALTNEIVLELQNRLRNCKFTKRTSSKHKKSIQTDTENKAGEQDWIKINACVLLIKPVEKILIRYDKTPSNFLCAFDKRIAEDPQKPAPEQNSLLNTLNRYLHHRRWVWIAQGSPKTKPPASVVCRILSMLLRLRLQEGFHIAHNDFGVISVVSEILMKGDCHDETPCVVQYVIFPPHTNTSVRAGCSDEAETTEADAESQLITECWVEPQVGRSYGCTGKRAHLNNLNFKEIALAFYNIDCSLISTVLTFEHIVLMCENPSVPSVSIPTLSNDICDEAVARGNQRTYNSPIHTPEEIFARKESNVSVVPFCFDIVKLVSKSQQSLLLFSTLVENVNFASLDNSAQQKSNAKLIDLVILQLSQIHDREIELSPRDNLYFIRFVRERCSMNQNPFPFYQDAGPTASENCSKWRCFAKVMPCTNVVVSLIPASFRDLLVLLTNGFTKDIPDQFIEMFPDHPEDGEGIELGNVVRCSLVLPLFVYKCNLSDATNLFFSDDLPSKNDVYLDNTLRSSASRKESFVSSMSEMSSGSRGSSEIDTYQTKKAALKTICKVIEGAVWSSLAMIVFQNLQKSVTVDKRDVAFVVTNVCQESRITVDIWPFLKCVCRHVKEFLLQSCEEKVRSDKKDAWGSKDMKKPKQLMSSPAEATLDLLKTHNVCSDIKDLHEVIKGRFMEIVLQYFARVDAESPYYVFKSSPAAADVDMQLNAQLPDYSSDLILSRNLSNSTPNITDLLSEACIAISNQKSNRNHLESTSLPCSLSSRECSFSSAPSNPPSRNSLDSESIEPEQEENDDLKSENSNTSEIVAPNVPLFLELQCVFQSAKGKGICTVETLPTCLADVISSLKYGSHGSDINFISVDLSIRCLTCGSFPSPSRFQTVCNFPNDTAATSSDETDSARPVNECPLPLPEQQKEVINFFISKLKWMLQDEIVASFLKSYPISEEVLDLVTDHIENSSDSRNCFKEEIPLKFVFEPQESLKRFMAIFCQINISGYHLRKEGKYYYLTFDREGTVDTPHSSFTTNFMPSFGFMDNTANFHSIDSTELSKIMCRDRNSTESSVARNNLSDTTTGAEETYGICSTRTSKSTIALSTSSSFSTVKNARGTNKRHDSAKDYSDESDENEETPYIKKRHHRKLSRHKEKTSSESRSASVPPLSPVDRKEESNKPGQSAPANVFSYLPDLAAVERSICETEQGVVKQSKMRHDVELSMVFKGTSAKHKERLLRHKLKEPMESSGSTPVACEDFSREDFTTVLEDPGYEGDSSDSGGDMNWQLFDSKLPYLPPFWIILRITAQAVVLYFHMRGEPDGTLLKNDAMDIVRKIKDLMYKNCKIVNQTVLLKNLHDCRMCHDLLVPNDEEAKLDDSRGKHYRGNSFIYDADTSIHTLQPLEVGKCFAAGFFQCDEVWQYHFPLHPRISSAPSRNNVSLGMHAIKSVLNAFSVNNRRNMFVYQEPSGKVFYMRVSEVACNGGCQESDSLHNISKSPSCSSVAEFRYTADGSAEDSTTGFRERINSTVSEKERSALQETLSVTSQASSTWDKNPGNKGPESRQCIVLHAYGIGDVGKDIKDEMTEALQKRLDEAVLDLLIVTLARNPHCKLTPRDVSFIQKPNKPPSLTKKFLIKPKMWQFLHPLKIYLRQNLLTYLHSPKYTEPGKHNHFQAYSNSTSAEEGSDDDDAFLYYRQQASGTSGSKGIACIVLSVVDGAENFVRSVSSPSVNLNTYHDLPCKDEFEEDTSCETFKEESVKAKGLEPLSMLRFQIWCVGKCDLEQLSAKLEGSVRWAYWDVITEYKFLTVPLDDKVEMEETLITSVPTSPKKERRSGMFLSEKEKLTLVSNLEKFESPSREFFSSVPDVRKLKPSSSSSPVSPKESYLASADGNTTPVKELGVTSSHDRSTVSNDESFSRNLDVYRTTLRSWLQFGASMNHPSVTAEQCKLTSKRSVPLFADEFSSYIKAFSGNVTVMTYMTDPENPNQSCPDEGSVDQSKSLSNCILIIRNTKLWQVFIGYHEERKAYLESLFSSKAKSHQRFPPHVCNFRNGTPLEFAPGYPLSAVSHTSLSSYSQLDIKSCISQEDYNYSPFVPRQKICLVFVEDKTINFLMYNWSVEAMNSIISYVHNLANWLNSRTSLLHSFVLQKMGLFRNQPFVRRPSSVSARGDRNSISYPSAPIGLPTAKTIKHPVAHSADVVELLIEHNSPIALNKKSKTSISETKKKTFADYCHLFRDCATVDGGETVISCEADDDHLRRFGSQARSLRKQDTKDLQDINKLWHPYVSKPQIALMERMMMKIKQLGRLQHFCATPLLFTTQWRQRVSIVRDYTLDCIFEDNKYQNYDEDRSRNNSGNSSKGSESVHSRVGKSSGHAPISVKSMRNSVDEGWHFAVCSHYIQEYVQYLQTLGFIAIQLRSQASSNSKPKPKEETSSASDSAGTSLYHKRSSRSGATSYYLYKSLMGGLLVFEVGVTEPYVYSYLYSLEGKRIQGAPDDKTHSDQFISSFLDEIDKVKMTMHLHSFTYDYHLRTIHSYISGRQLIFKQGYHLISFLEDFIKYYQKAPNYARNHIHAGEIAMNNMSVSPDQLYNYITSHNERYGMSVFRMVPPFSGDQDADTATEFVLVQLSSQSALYRDHLDSRQLDNFDFGLLICQNAAAERDRATLSLKYFLLLTSQREIYPKLSHYTYGSAFGSFKPIRLGMSQPPSRAISRKNSFGTEIPSEATSNSFSSQSTKETSLAVSTSTEISKPPPSKKVSNSSKIVKSGMCDEEVCYLGYFSSHETMMLSILKDRAEAAHTHLRAILEQAAIHCRRDSLWQALITERGFLSYNQFTELLRLVRVKPISEFDATLSPFMVMHVSFYQTLAKTLNVKYGSYHKQFVSPDNRVIKHIYMNKAVDGFMLLSINADSSSAEMSLVVKEEPETLSSEFYSQYSRLVEDFVNGCAFHLWASLST